MPHISEAAPLQISRFYTGLYTYRNPLIVPIRQFGRRIIELYDAISGGLNMENSNRLTLPRRPGYTAFNSNPVNGIPLFFYSFKPTNFANQVYVVADTTADLEWIQTGSAANTVLATKDTPALTNFSQIGAYLYIANPNSLNGGGISSSTIKWDSPSGVQGITRWGIDINAANGAIGPRNFNFISNLPTTNPLLQAAPAWGGAVGGITSVTVPGTNNPGTPNVSQFLELNQFGFNSAGNPWGPAGITTAIPPPYVTGVIVELSGFDTGGQGTFFQVGLELNDAIIGETKQVTLPPNGTTASFGSPSDLWGTNIQPNDVVNFTFGVAIQAVNATPVPATYTITGVGLAVFIVSGPQVQEVAGGTLSASVGYQYVYTYGNSFSGHVSSPTFPSDFPGPNSPLIGPFTNNSINVGLIASPDPQVNQIHVYRTTDGGGQPFFELPTSPYPNKTQTISDEAQDWQLQLTQIAPLPHFNDPPVQGSVDPVWYGGRLWMHKGSKLYFSSGPDITQGNAPEAWFPPYVFLIPHATIVRKFPIPNGMLIVTNDNIYIVRGTSTTSFTVNDFMQDTGIRVWTAADTDGTNVYLYTSDRQLLLINPNGMTSISQNIADIITAVDPALAYLTQFRYTATQNFIFLGDGSTFIYPYNQELQCWMTLQAPVGGVRAISNVETSVGVFQFLRGKPIPSSTVTFRDTTVFADEGTPYPAQVIFGPIPVADFLTLAQIRDVALALAPTLTRVFVSVLPNEVLPVAQKQFQIMDISSTEPPELSADPTLSFRNDRYTWKSTTYPEFLNFVFLRVDFDAVPNPDEIWNYTLGGTQTTGGSSLGQPGQLPQLQGR